MCDCFEEQKRKEKEAKAAKEAEAKARAAQAEAKAAARAVSRAAATRSSSDVSTCTATCRSSGANASTGLFSWLWGGSQPAPRPKPAVHDCVNPKEKPPPPRSPIFFWMGMLLGTMLLYVGFAYLYCALKDLDWRSRLESFRALFCDPCATMQFVYGLLEGIRARAGQALASFRGSKKACSPKPTPPC